LLLSSQRKKMVRGGTMYVAGNVVAPAAGVWIPSDYQAINADLGCAWDSMQYVDMQQQCYGSWIQSSKLPLQVESESTICPSSQNSDAMSEGSETPHAEPRRVQSAARAAKRQRGRERRKMYRAAAQAAKLQTQNVDNIKQSQGFEVRAAAAAAELQLVVRKTFVDVDDQDESLNRVEIHLPAAFFESTREIDEWRRNYRLGRMGYHRGAKGEITSLVLDRVPSSVALAA
jgi:hypothetical protein